MSLHSVYICMRFPCQTAEMIGLDSAGYAQLMTGNNHKTGFVSAKICPMSVYMQSS